MIQNQADFIDLEKSKTNMQLNYQPKVVNKTLKQKEIYDSEIYVGEGEDTDSQNQQNSTKNEIMVKHFTKLNDGPSNQIKTEQSKDSFLRFASSKSMHLEDNYFEEDQEEKEEQKLVKYSVDIKNLKSYNMIFRKGQFFEFFLYHFIYFVILGPFTAIITKMQGKYLSRNLQFLGRSGSVYIQLFNYLMSIITFIFYLSFPNPTLNSAVYLSTLIIVIVFRCFQIATKYATFDPLKIKIYKEVKVDLQDLRYDLFLQDWSDQTDKIIYEQIYYTQRFFDTDPNLFFIQFMIEPSKKTLELIKISKEKMEDQFNLRKTHKKPEPIGVQTNTEYYDGYTIVNFLISLYQKTYSSKKRILRNSVLMGSIVRGLLPLICALIIQFSASALGMTWNEVVINLILSVQVQFLYSAIFLQMTYGLSDFHRKLTILEELTYMLIPRKIGESNAVKVLPTINIIKKESLKGWSTLRKSIMAYGKSYSIRVEILIAVMAIYAFSCITLICLTYFKVIELNIVIILEISFDSFLMIVIVCFVLFWGANLNKTFSDQITNLYNNKIYIQDLLLVQNSYVNKGKTSNNFLYNKGLQIAKQNLEENQTVKEYLEDLLDYYQQIIDEVQYDQQNHPFTFLGITVTPIVLKSLVVALVSVGSSILANYINNYINTQQNQDQKI